MTMRFFFYFYYGVAVFNNQMKVHSERKRVVIGLCFLLGSVLVMIKG